MWMVATTPWLLAWWMKSLRLKITHTLSKVGIDMFKKIALNLVLIYGIGASAITCAQSTEDPPIVLIATKDPDMANAIKTARSQLNDFFKVAENPPANTTNFKLKVMFKDGNTVEHMWVQPFTKTKTGFEGTLVNEPRHVSNVKNGQLIQFQLQEISDWGYLKNNRQVGSFTVCVLFSKMNPETVKTLRSQHGFDC
jgi:uncharacterized protein YegJ (DUF2314 family)